MIGQVSLCSAIAFPATTVPDWIHLLPAGEIRGRDGRGPFRIGDTRTLIALSMAGGKLVLDENHATDLAAPQGGSAPARGWIVELQSRPDGVWGRIEWTAEGKRIMTAGEYRGVSPAIEHTKAGEVIRLHRASLTNTPNFTGLVTLHAQWQGTFRAQLVERLGLDRGKATDEIVIAAALRALSPTPIAVAAILDELPTSRTLTPADFAAIDALGLDVQTYRDEKTKGEADPMPSLHSFQNAGALSPLERRVADALGIDPLTYVTSRGRWVTAEKPLSLR